MARWRITHFLRHAREQTGDNPVFGKLRKAVETIDKQLERWTLTYSNARTETLNGIFKAARAREIGYRNVAMFITMIYLIAAASRVARSNRLRNQEDMEHFRQGLIKVGIPE